MKHFLISFASIGSGMLCFASLAIWAGSYFLGILATTYPPSSQNGSMIFSIQRGVLAVQWAGFPWSGNVENDFVLLNHDQMIDFETNPAADFGNSQFPRMVLFSREIFPWNWHVSGAGFEAYVPLWILTLLFAVAPVIWLTGLVKSKERPLNETIARKKIEHNR
jgi:hypothetical protein